ncbi:synaptotagmin-like protein 4 [Betta splendens]|uniref:Synaptotagmin-like protein 4 n=1 Tax=Betta splendens TaxID=158456 RepID=A0A6P7NLY1_BETSP|nr:synaptotagmin-like protein 4 [Betta splendens]
MPQSADMINLGFLSDAERELILQVLQRDEELRQTEEQRVRRLKTELLDVKKKAAKRASGNYSQRSCGRCLEPLNRLSLSLFSESFQCKVCKHHVCRKCQTVLPNGSWVCNVCAKESDLKKRTGDWFYDQRINRFSTTPGHDLVKVSLKKKQPLKKRETAGEVLLRSAEVNPDAPTPVPRPRQKNQAADKGGSSASGSVASGESLDSKQEVWPKPNRDTESVGKASRSSSKAETDPAEPEQARSRTHSARSNVSSLAIPVNVIVAGSDCGDSEANPVPEEQPAGLSPEALEVNRLFKKSVKRSARPPEHVSTLDLRVGSDKLEASMGNRSRSVPGLDLKENEEEDEDIDSLVRFHKRTMAGDSKRALGSMMSIYSEAGDFDSVEVSGEVVFTVSYDEHAQSLHVLVKECRELAYGDAARRITNPYVKCYLLPDKSRQSKKKTSIKRRTINPVYNETLKYSISRSQLFTRSLLISVWHHGRLSRNAFLGEAEVALDCQDLDSPTEDCVVLMAKSASAPASAQYKGELVISLKYIPPKKPESEKSKGKKAATGQGGELHVLIKEAKNLTAMKTGGTSDSFVKGYLFPKSTKQKTPVVKKNLNPHYDHTFVYKDLSQEQLKEMCLELTVWDREAMSSNEFLGGVRLSCGAGAVQKGKEEVDMDSAGEEVSLWEKMMQYPDSWAEGTLPLRATMGKGK